MKASPAPVVSTGVTRTGAMGTTPARVTSRAPRPPSVTITVPMPRSIRLRAAAAISSSLPVGRPEISASSLSFGTRKLRSRRSSTFRSAAAGAGFRMVRTPHSAARRTVWITVSRGTSICIRIRSAARSVSSAVSTSAGKRSAFAPFTIRIEFSPDASTKIGATPEDLPATVSTWRMSMPCWARLRRVFSPKMSSPTFVTMLTALPSFAAATA